MFCVATSCFVHPLLETGSVETVLFKSIITFNTLEKLLGNDFVACFHFESVFSAICFLPN